MAWTDVRPFSGGGKGLKPQKLCEHQTCPQSLWAMRSASESVGSASLHTRYVLDTHVVVVLALGVS